MILLIIGRYLLYPILFKPKLNFEETYDFFKTKNCIYISYREAGHYESTKYREQNKPMVNDLFSVVVLYRVLAKELDNNTYKIFWVEIQSWLTPMVKNKVRFIEEQDIDIINEINDSLASKVVNIDDHCPACNNPINKTDTVCNDCGLTLK